MKQRVMELKLSNFLALVSKNYHAVGETGKVYLDLDDMRF